MKLIESVQQFDTTQEPKQIQSVQKDWEDTWELEFAAKNPVLYPLARMAANFIPFAWMAFPSGREEFTESSTWGKAAFIGLDLVAFAPGLGPLVGKGLKVTAKPLVKVVGNPKLPFRIAPISELKTSYADELMKKLDDFVYTTPERGLISKYKLSDPAEIKAARLGRKAVEDPVGRSGFLVPRADHQLSKEFKALFKKDGAIRKDVADNLSRWSATPAEQHLAHEISLWEQIVKSQLKTNDYSLDDVFKHQSLRLFGKDQSARMSLGNVGAEDLDLLIRDALVNRGKILRYIDARSWHYVAPIRKVYGVFNDRWDTIRKIYNPVQKGVRARNAFGNMAIAQFHGKMVAAGLGKMKKSGAFQHLFDPDDWKKAGEFITQRNLMTEAGRSTEEIQALMNNLSYTAQRITKVWEQYADYLYHDFLLTRIPQIFERAPLNEIGKIRAEHILKRSHAGGPAPIKQITALFGESSNLRYEDKLRGVQELSEFLQTRVKNHLDWFKGFDEGEEGLKAARRAQAKVISQLRIRTGDQTTGLPNYLQNYSHKMFKESRSYAPKLETLPKKMEASFVKSRTGKPAELEEVVTDLSDIISRRVRGQANELYLYPMLEDVMKELDTLPPGLRRFTEHYLNRVLGRASQTDKRVAEIVNATFGTNWDGDRVQRLAYGINDLIYMGGIGFKPFSAIRNYFQVPLTVPADLGGIKDVVWLAKGYRRAFSRDFRDYMKEIGAITEYAPDLLFHPQVVKFAKTLNIGGKSVGLPSGQRLRDLAMWMFKNTDQHNRYVAGGAAYEKWMYHLRKLAKKEPDGSLRLTEKGLADFKKKLNLKTREDWVRADIEEALAARTTEGLQEAQKLWIKDVVADTQFLYGSADSPLFNQFGGGITKTAAVFQSWWMNYGSLLGKWMFRSGDVGVVRDRMFTWMLSSAVSYAVMRQFWDKRTSASTVFTGPLPLDPGMPASWRPFIDATRAIVAAGGIPLGIEDVNTVRSKMIATIRSGMIYAPGGIQAWQSVPKLVQGDIPGLMKTLIRYKD